MEKILLQLKNRSGRDCIGEFDEESEICNRCVICNSCGLISGYNMPYTRAYLELKELGFHKFVVSALKKWFKPNYIKKDVIRKSRYKAERSKLPENLSEWRQIWGTRE